jgi:hypothetical protein
MKIDEFLIAPLNFKIQQDWTKILSTAEILINRAKTQHTEVCEQGYAYFYHLGPLGSITHHYGDVDWNDATGPWIYKHAPWLKTLENDTRHLGMTWSISISTNNINTHVDFDHNPTAVIYPINTTDAETYVIVDDKEHVYPSMSDQPWILNTQYPHGVRNNEKRVTLNLKFKADYATVKQWFDSQKNKVYN